MNYNWLKTTDCKERDAYYQAGHAVIVLQEALEVVQIFIEDNGSSWIEVQYPDLSQSRLSRSVRARSDAKAVIRALLAGPATQLRYSFGTCDPDDPLPDFDLAAPYMIESEAVWRAISLSGRISKDSPSLICSSWRRVNRLVHGDKIWQAIAAVADALLINGELAGGEVREIANYAINRRTKHL
jgi:hypothetical protein